MIKANVYNILYDVKEFIRSNAVKFFILFAVNVAAIIFGIKGGFTVSSPADYLSSHPSNAYNLIAGKRGIFGYFFMELLINFLILFTLTVTSVHFLISYLTFAITFLRSYMFSLYIGLFIKGIKLASLPFIILCLAPYYLFSLFIYFIVSVLCINRAKDIRLYGHCSKNSFACYLHSVVFPCIMLGIVVLLASVSAYFLTLGIIL